MNSAICTLFEEHYHYGVAALINSLYHQGFRGSIYAGYRGKLPEWASCTTENPSINWQGATSLQVAEGLDLNFLPLNTDYHLTNYKPDFMLQLWDGIAKHVDALAYFDPDIVIKCRWAFFETWMKSGVAVVHDITENDMPPNHPIRLQWEEILLGYGFKIERSLTSYINAGFCGVHRDYKQILFNWKFLIGKGVSDYNMNIKQMTSFDKTYPFCFLDQDSLNMALIGTNIKVSEMGPSAMDFVHGGVTMSHAVGSPKPWKKKFIYSALKGNSPSIADKVYWMNTQGPIRNFSTIYMKKKYLSIKLASIIGRFYHRQ